MSSKPTIRDVAKLANVSVATVSRVINNKGYVYEETKKMVLAAVEELGFEPNQLARSLTNHGSKMIGVIVPHFRNVFYSQLVEGIEKAALSYGYKTMLCNTRDEPQRELDYLRIFEQYNVDGIIVAANFQNRDELLKLDIPVVSVDHIISDEIPSISSNNYNGGKLAAKVLLEKGAKHVLLLRGPSFLLVTKERTKGFEEVFENYDATLSIHDFDLVEPDANFIYEVLKNTPTIDGIFAMSDNLSLIALSCLEKLGKKVPDDVALVGFDDAPFAKWTNPAISTISQSVQYIGINAIEVLLRQINNEPLSNNHITIDVKFEERDTTKK